MISAFLIFAAAFNQKPLLEFSEEGGVISWKNGIILLEEEGVILLTSNSSTFAGLDLEIDRLPVNTPLCCHSKF
jgi:hypothetical protein